MPSKLPEDYQPWTEPDPKPSNGAMMKGCLYLVIMAILAWLGWGAMVWITVKAVIHAAG